MTLGINAGDRLVTSGMETGNSIVAASIKVARESLDSLKGVSDRSPAIAGSQEGSVGVGFVDGGAGER